MKREEIQKCIAELPATGFDLPKEMFGEIRDSYPIYYNAIIHHLQEAANCYFSIYVDMISYNPTELAQQKIHDQITWAVIDEAKAHFKSEMNRMGAEILMQAQLEKGKKEDRMS